MAEFRKKRFTWQPGDIQLVDESKGKSQPDPASKKEGSQEDAEPQTDGEKHED